MLQFLTIVEVFSNVIKLLWRCFVCHAVWSVGSNANALSVKSYVFVTVAAIATAFRLC